MKGQWVVESPGDAVESAGQEPPVAPSQAPVEAPGVGDKLGRQLGLTGRAAVTGALALPAMGADALGAIWNLGLKAYGAATGQDVDRLRAVPQMQQIEQMLTKAGVPEPQGAGERIAYDASRAMAGAATTMGAAGAAAPTSAAGQGVQQSLMAAPGMQLASGASGAAASGLTREAGGGPVAQLAAGIAGSLLPTAAREGGALAVRGALGGRPQTMQGNIADFAEAGTTPTVGQATEGRAQRAAESLLSRVPGGAGVLAAKAEQQQQQIGSRVDELARNLAPRADSASAGRQIEKGISGFVDAFKQKASTLYGDADFWIPPDKAVRVGATMSKLDELATPIQGAENTSKFFINKTLVNVRDAMQADLDANGGRLPYQAVKKLRTMIGNMLASNELIDDLPRSKLKQVYGALSEDMLAHAKAVGPNATAAVTRANDYWRAGMDRVDTLQRVANKIDFENIYRAATSGTKEGATTLRAVMRSIPRDARDAVTATFVKKMGQQTPGRATTDEPFSTETFLTNWNKLSPEAKIQMFADDELRRGLDAVVNVARNIRSGSKVFFNPSGTGQALALNTGVGGAVLATLLGKPLVAATILAGMGGANVSARLMSNPTFVKWLATTSRVPIEQAAAQLNNLARQSPEAAQAARLLLQGQQNADEQGQ